MSALAIDNFLARFHVDDDAQLLKAEAVRQKMYLAAIKAIGDCTKRNGHWLSPKVQANGYAYCKVAGKTYTISRLVLCCATGKPLNYNIDGELQAACHKTPLCPHRNCINPAHLFWDDQEENLKRRDLEEQARSYVREMLPEFVPGRGL